MDNLELSRIARKVLMADEGFSREVYLLYGIRHIGYGFNLDGVGMYKEEADFILANRVNKAMKELKKQFPNYELMSDARKLVLINLCYNLGIHGLLGFRRFVEACGLQDWVKAAKELLDSKAHKQNPARMERLAYLFEMDKM